MIKTRHITGLNPILSRREIEVVVKRLENRHITQTESNYLSRSVRPKLESAEFAASYGLLSLLGYRRKRYEREDRLLRKKILMAVKEHINLGRIRAVVVFGSYIRNSHINYRDIDIMVVLNKKKWKNSAERNKLESLIENAADIELDVNLVFHKEFLKLLPYSPLLQTQLESSEVLYGSINTKKNIIINNEYLYKKLLETEYALELGKSVKPQYIYNSIRSCLSIGLFLKRIVDYRYIMNAINSNIGKSTAESLINNRATPVQREIALAYLKDLYKGLIGALK
jgi:predicted nucleotidyltransferase